MTKAIATLTAILLGTTAVAQDVPHSLYGTPGLIEMPTAQMDPDGQVTGHLGVFAQQQRGSFSFQLTPRLAGTFRYTRFLENYGLGEEYTFDRSFDLRYRILDEGQLGSWTPALAIGIQDFMGTGKLSAEYIVASKTITPDIIATAGLGWGRFGTQGGFTNPLGTLSADFETRPVNPVGLGGKVSTGQFFKGDAAFFGGINWQYSDKLAFKAEYSSDAYVRETDIGTIDIKSPVNVGLSYQWRPGITLDLAYLYGSEVAAGLTFGLNPRNRAAPSGTELAPTPVRARGGDRAVLASWGVTSGTSMTDAVRSGLRAEGMRLHGFNVSGDTARLRYSNNWFRSEAQALGRAARVLTQVLPDNVTRLVLEPMQQGIALSSTTLNRADVETLSTTATGAADLRARANFGDAGGLPALAELGDPDRPAFTWGLGPYTTLTLFNANNPAQLDLGLELRAQYEFNPNLVLKGGVRQTALGKNPLATTVDTQGSYHRVRTDGDKYGGDGTPILTDLTLSYYGRPAENLYSRVTLGYLENMYGGVSTELLWKPVDSRLAVGAELNYARQRDFDLGFGFQDYEAITGHLSAYYAMENGFHTTVSAGRYLAGDWGGTVALDREFANGWKVGAYFTVTDMPFEDFGEGSFDKGIRVTVPTDFFMGNASRSTTSSELASLSRDGGARVKVEGRLYDVVREGHVAGPMGDTWGRVWR